MSDRGGGRGYGGGGEQHRRDGGGYGAPRDRPQHVEEFKEPDPGEFLALYCCALG